MSQATRTRPATPPGRRMGPCIGRLMRSFASAILV